MKTTVLALACALSLSAQHHFSWQNACFNNPALPYCQGHDYAVKRTKPGKGQPAAPATANTDAVEPMPEDAMPSVITVGGINWRFADPAADALASISFSRLPASPVVLSLLAGLGARQGLTAEGMAKILDALSGVDQIALSIHGNETLVFVSGYPADATPPALEPGWKASPLPNAMLIGPAGAVDQALQRIASDQPLTALARSAGQLQSNGDFYVFGSPRSVAPDALNAKLKEFSLKASMRNRLISDAAYDFNQTPDAGALQLLPADFGQISTDRNLVHLKMSMEVDDLQPGIDRIAATPLGWYLGAILQAARYLPVRDSSQTAAPKPVIYGLDDGPKEVGQPQRRKQ